MTKNYGSSFTSSLKSSLAYRMVRSLYYYRDTDHYKSMRQRHLRNDKAMARDYIATSKVAMLHLGCGHNRLTGWLNSDYFPDDRSVCHIDATSTFPIADDSFDLIFSEHMIEHLRLAGGAFMLGECCRVLKPGGRIRVSTPSLDSVIAIFQEPEREAHAAYIRWHLETWLPDTEFPTPATVFNDFVRNWGHLYIYDTHTLMAAMSAAGFVDVTACSINKSQDPRLCGLENETRMPAGLLQLHTVTLEGVKPGPHNMTARTA